MKKIVQSIVVSGKNSKYQNMKRDKTVIEISKEIRAMLIDEKMERELKRIDKNYLEKEMIKELEKIYRDGFEANGWPAI